MEIADRVSVLRQGKMIESGVPVAGTTMNELAQMMVGRDVELSVTRRADVLLMILLELLLLQLVPFQFQ